MKKLIAVMLILCLLFVGCGKADEAPDAVSKPTENQVEAVEGGAEAALPEAEEPAEETPAEEEAPAKRISPLPDTAMDNLEDAILSVSLEEGDAYVDDTGKMQMDLKIYSYDKYDMVDVAAMEAGDILLTHCGEVEIASLERGEDGRVYINGGLDEDGLELVSDDCGIFYEIGYNDAKSWYEAGEATIRVSADFMGYDNADIELGEVLLYPGDFLVGAVSNYDFNPRNTTVRVESGQIVEMNRIFVP